MEFNTQWDLICRICLHEGEMRSIFEEDEMNMPIYDKIIKCSNLTIKRGMSLPEQICKSCLDDLNAAYRFRINCENSDAILQSVLDGNTVTDLIVSSNNGEVLYKYKPPSGLNVKRIKGNNTNNTKIIATKITTNNHNEIGIKLEPMQTITEDTLNESNIIVEDPFITEDDYIEEDNNVDDDIVVVTSNNDEIPFEIKEEITPKEKKPTKRGRKPKNKDAEIIEDGNNKKHRECSKSNKNSESKVKTEKTQDITMKPDGTILRIRKTRKENPLKICDICGNTYKYKHALESHMRRHRNEKPFACEICGRAFVINFELRRHMRTHTGQKPYMCRYCGRRFSDFGSRIKHERTHTGERPYACDTCGKAFSYSHVLQSHILTHTGEKRFECTVCNKRFTKSHHLKAHMNTHNKHRNKQQVVIKQSATQYVIASKAPSTWIENSNINDDNKSEENEQKLFIRSPDEKIIFETTTDDKVFFIKEKKEEEEEELDFNQIC